MRLSSQITLVGRNQLDNNLSKKIMLANTADKQKNIKGFAEPIDPIYFSNSNRVAYNPDIRYRDNYGFNSYQNIDLRNALLLFAENYEIKKVLNAIANDICVTKLEDRKYPVYPKINLTTLTEDKIELGNAIQNYLDEIFYPELWRMFKFAKLGLQKKTKEYLTAGKLAWEIRYDNIIKPKNIEDIVPIDPSTLQKVKIDGNIWYVQKSLDGGERILHDNQVILIEWNEYDFGYISYVDSLRRPYNIMRSMQNAKILWFAVKSQVRMHVKFAYGDVPRKEAYQRLTEAKEEFANVYEFDDETGKIFFNGSGDSVGYHEYYTAETQNSGSPEIEEINTNGPDLTEVDSLQYWEKLYYRQTEVPMDRIDPNSSETFSFIDVTNIRNIEKQYAKFLGSIRIPFEEAILKTITIQLTLKEAEIGIDLSLLDSIGIEWMSLNEYEELGVLEILNKKVELAQNLAQFGDMEDVNGKQRKFVPLSWIVKNYMDFSQEQLISMDNERKAENVWLGFNPDGTDLIDEENTNSNEDNEEYNWDVEE